MTDKRNNSIRNTNEPENSNMEEDDVNISIEVSGNFTTASSNSRRCDQHESEDTEASSSRTGSKAEVDAFSYCDSKMSKDFDSNSVDKGEHVQTETNVSSIPVSASSNQTDSHSGQYSCSSGQENELLNQEVCSKSDSYKSNSSQVEELERNPIAANSDRELQHISPSSDSEKGLKNLSFPSEMCVKPERQKCEKSADVQNCRVEIDENQRRIYENVDHSNYVGSKSDEQNKITESRAEIKEDTKTIENDRHKMQQPTVNKQHLQSSSDKSKIDINIENSKNSKDKGQELYTHTKTQYKTTSRLTDERVENSSKDNDQELCTGTKTDCKTAITRTDGTVNTPETDENAKAALEKARKWNTCDDEEYDMVYVYDYKKDNGFIEACEKYVYFWKNKDIYSQWHKSNFVVNDKTFNCVEQFMTYKKAELFEDTDIAKKILSEKSPRIIKSLGGQVKNFSEELWAANCLYVVKQANIAKFSQDEHFKKELFATYPKLLVEASPLDKIWGIGLAENDCEAWDKTKWRGKNLLGYILTEVRDELMFEAEKIQKHERKEYLESLMKVLIQEAIQSNKQKKTESDRSKHGKSGKKEHKVASKNTEQSEKKSKEKVISNTMTDKRNNSIRNTNEPENSNMEEDDVNISVEVSGNFTTASSNSRRCDQHESEDTEASSSRTGSKAEVDALPYGGSKMSKDTDCNSVDKSEHVQTETNVSSIPVSAFSNQTDSHRSQHSCSPGQENELLNQGVCTMSDSYKSNSSQVEELERNPIAANSDRELQHISPSSDSEKGLKNLSFPSEMCVKPERQKCEKSADVQNCRVEIDENQRRNENVDHSNYVGSKSDEQNKITESRAEIKEDTKTIENDRHKMQQPTVNKQHLQSSSDKSKIDINIENSKNSKDEGQELYTHTKTQYKATSRLTDERVENSNKDNDQELCTGTKTDCKTAITRTDGTVNTPETDENAKSALEKARKWNTCDDEEYDMVYVYDYKKENDCKTAITRTDGTVNTPETDENAKAALEKARKWYTRDDEEYDMVDVYDYKKDNGFIEACEKYVYFWKNKDIYSQWHKSNFVVNDKTFNCVEQFMMYKKAELFEDTDITKKILSEKSQRIIKSLGGQVKNFSEELWAANCLYVVKQANIAKFSQDEHFKKELFATYPKLLVKASPLDKIWGIGLAEDDCEAWDETKWRGKNLLGYILTEVRDELMFEAGKNQKHERKEYLESLTKVQTQEAIQSNKQRKTELERSKHGKPGEKEHKAASKNTEQSEKKSKGKTNLRPKSKTDAIMETENDLEKIKHESNSLRQTATERGKVQDEIEKPNIDSSSEQGSKGKWLTESLGQPGTRENPVTDVDRNTDSSVETGFLPEESKELSGCQQEKETLVKYNKCDGNKGTSPGPLCDSLQHKESFGRQGDKETVVEKDGCE